MCTSGEAEDLATTDRIATEIVAGLRDSSPEKSKQQYEDNYLWITQAADHKLVRANPTARLKAFPGDSHARGYAGNMR